MTNRFRALLVCAAGALAPLVVPAKAQTIASSLAAMRSGVARSRIDGFNELKTLTRVEHLPLCSPKTRPDIKRGLIAGLETENRVPKMPTEEEADDYYGDLVGCVAALRDSLALDALLGAINTGGGATDGLVALGDVAVPELLRLASTTAFERGSALFTLGQLVRGEGPPISAANREAIRRRALASLRDHDRFVRQFAIDALKPFSDAEVRRAIEALAVSDPATTRPAPGKRGYPVRDAARDWLKQDSLKARASAFASCDSTSRAVCYADTATTEPYDPAMPGPIVGANWILFAERGDSLELSVSPRAFVATSVGEEHNRDGTTASVFRHRVDRDGVLTAYISMDNLLGDSVPYELSVQRIGAPPRENGRTGRFATLSVSAASSRSRFSIVPLSMDSTIRDRSEWTTFVGTYRVALVGDSLYVVCDVPCNKRQTVRLQPSTKKSIRF